MSPHRKITVHIPEDLLGAVLEASGNGLTATVRRGMELEAAGRSDTTGHKAWPTDALIAEACLDHDPRNRL
jgi:hypothetical protein